MTLINDRAHDVVDKACENLARWPYDFVGQEDLVMLIHEAIEAAVEEEREACAMIANALAAEFRAKLPTAHGHSIRYESYDARIKAADCIKAQIRARSDKITTNTTGDQSRK